MNLWIPFVGFIILEIIFTPLFLKAQWPGMCLKSLVYKMICSTSFVGIGILSVFISENKSTFAIMMLAGLILGWIGDYFLHAKPTNTYFAIGFVSFMLGHIVYIACYIRTIPVIAPDYNFINIPEIAISLILLAVAIVLAVKFKVEFSTKVLKCGVVVYTVILVVMFIKATTLGVQYYLTGSSDGILAILVLSLGSLLFLLSDATIGLIMFGGQKKNKPLKVFNIVTYFAGQALLASSILFIKG